MRLECISVRARSANDGSGTADWPLVAPLACFPKDEEDIAESSLGLQRIMRPCLSAFASRPNPPSRVLTISILGARESFQGKRPLDSVAARASGRTGYG